MTPQHTPAAGSGQTITTNLVTKAFEAWENAYRKEPDNFLTPEECDRMEVAPLAERSAIYFMALLREVAKAAKGGAGPLPAAPDSVTLLVRGLQIDAQGVESGVVHLTVRANQQHQGLLGRLRQHIANALFRAADACHPGQHHRALRVVQPMVLGATLQHELPHRTETNVRDIWPLHDALGNAHYNALFTHEGVKRHHDGRAVAGHCLDGAGQKGADDFQGATPVNPAMFAGATIVVLPDALPCTSSEVPL